MESDEQALSIIAKRIKIEEDLDQRVRKSFEGKDIHIFGPVTKRDVVRHYQESTTIAVEGITGIVLSEGVVPNIVVTDLDSDHEFLAKAGQKGALLLVHIHGDNLHQVESFFQAHELSRVVLTTQTMPREGIKNYLGFTDGDRAAFFAKTMGAKAIHLHGFALDGPIVSQNKLISNYEEWKKRKQLKLQIAKTLLCWLGGFVNIIDHDEKTSWPSNCTIRTER